MGVFGVLGVDLYAPGGLHHVTHLEKVAEIRFLFDRNVRLNRLFALETSPRFKMTAPPAAAKIRHTIDAAISAVHPVFDTGRFPAVPAE